MLGLKQRFGLFIVAGLAMTGISRQASAKTIMTPFGEADESCVHEIPMGASVDTETGDVKMKGAVVGHFDPCPMSVNLDRLNKKTQPPAPGGWYEYSQANATTISGMTQFDYYDGSWTVPSDPVSPNNTDLLYYFPALQNLNSSGTPLSIIQPVLQWGSNNSWGGAYWNMAAWEVWNGGSSIGHSPPVTVYAGDGMYGYMEQIDGSPDTDEWQVYVSDTTTSGYTYNQIWPSSSWPKYNWLTSGAFEGYGGASHNTALDGCAYLSHANTITFYVYDIEEAGPAWNTYNYLNPNALSWATKNNPNSLSPSCSWSPSLASDDSYVTLAWMY
jgi:hypothetical protein